MNSNLKTISFIFASIICIYPQSGRPDSLSSVPVTCTKNLVIEKSIDISGDFMGFGFGSLWLPDGSRLNRIQPNTNKIEQFNLPDSTEACRGVAFGADSVWVPDCGNGKVYRVDAKSGEILNSVAVKLLGSEGSVAAGLGSVWVIATRGEGVDELDRIDEKTGNIVARTPLPARGAGVTFDGKNVWVTSPISNSVYEIDSSRDSIVMTVHVHDQPRFIASDENGIWVFTQGDGTVEHIDGKTGKIIASITTGLEGSGGDITIGGGSIWLSQHSAPVTKINAAENRVEKRFDGPGYGDAIRYGGGSLWVSGRNLSRITPPNLQAPQRDKCDDTSASSENSSSQDRMPQSVRSRQTTTSRAR